MTSLWMRCPQVVGCVSAHWRYRYHFLSSAKYAIHKCEPVGSGASVPSRSANSAIHSLHWGSKSLSIDVNCVTEPLGGIRSTLFGPTSATMLTIFFEHAWPVLWLSVYNRIVRPIITSYKVQVSARIQVECIQWFSMIFKEAQSTIVLVPSPPPKSTTFSMIALAECHFGQTIVDQLRGWCTADTAEPLLCLERRSVFPIHSSSFQVKESKKWRCSFVCITIHCILIRLCIIYNHNNIYIYIISEICEIGWMNMNEC